MTRRPERSKGETSLRKGKQQKGHTAAENHAQWPKTTTAPWDQSWVLVRVEVPKGHPGGPHAPETKESGRFTLSFGHSHDRFHWNLKLEFTQNKSGYNLSNFKSNACGGYGPQKWWYTVEGAVRWVRWYGTVGTVGTVRWVRWVQWVRYGGYGGYGTWGYDGYYGGCRYAPTVPTVPYPPYHRTVPTAPSYRTHRTVPTVPTVPYPPYPPYPPYHTPKFPFYSKEIPWRGPIWS